MNNINKEMDNDISIVSKKKSKKNTSINEQTRVKEVLIKIKDENIKYINSQNKIRYIDLFCGLGNTRLGTSVMGEEGITLPFLKCLIGLGINTLVFE